MGWTQALRALAATIAAARLECFVLKRIGEENEPWTSARS
jgi:hypothetical protein